METNWKAVPIIKARNKAWTKAGTLGERRRWTERHLKGWVARIGCEGEVPFWKVSWVSGQVRDRSETVDFLGIGSRNRLEEKMLCWVADAECGDQECRDSKMTAVWKCLTRQELVCLV